ncbi:MAG: ABC transporter permease [Cyclobacteriaceae bacterium]
MATDKQHIEPPRFGTYLLQRIYGRELYDEISGDMLEIYADRLQSHGKAYASFHYMVDAVQSLRNYDLRKKNNTTQNNSIAMFRNYFKITLRTITKNKVYSALNIMGLALGIAAFVFILQYVTYENSYDKFHTDHEHIYRVRYKVYRGEELNIDCAAAVPRVGPFMKEKMSEVIDFARAFPVSGVMSTNNNQFRENRIHVTDPAFLSIFDYPLIQGDAGTALSEPNKVVITEEMALKYFGTTDVIGRPITFNSWFEMSLQVSGVTINVPDNSHFKYDFLISYETLNNRTRDEETGRVPSEEGWGWYDFNTYVLLRDGTDPAAFDRKFNDYLLEERGEDFAEYNFRAEFPLQKLTDIHLYSNLLQESEPEEQGDGQAVFFLTIIAFFILVIAWINYINLSTARSVERAKEVGVRKTMGAYKKQLIYQFMAEAVILNFMALIVGLLIVFFGINYFNQLTGSQLSLDFLLSLNFWLVAGGVFITGAGLSGLYPAFILSSFRPSDVLKGKFSGNKAGNTLRKVLVVFQFAASVALITGTIIFYQQLAHMRNADLGFDMTDTLVMKGPAVFGADSLFTTTMNTFKNEMLKYTEIEAISASSNVPGDEIFWTNSIRKNGETPDKAKTIYIVGIDYAYFDTYDIELLAGRNYSKTFSTDTGSMILNASAIRYLGFESPEAAINQKVMFWDYPKTIIGVVDDYKQMSAKTAVSPIIFPLALDENNFLTLKLNVDDYSKAFEITQTEFDRFFPGNPFDYFFLDDFFNRQYDNEREFSRVFTLFAVFAIIVACLGLFGLSSFSAIQRTKEIGIRKAIGADISNIIFILTREFMQLILVSIVIAFPLIYLVMDGWLDNFAVRINLGIPVFLLAGLVVILIAILTVGYKTLITAKSDPVKALRYE